MHKTDAKNGLLDCQYFLNIDKVILCCCIWFWFDIFIITATTASVVVVVLVVSVVVLLVVVVVIVVIGVIVIVEVVYCDDVDTWIESTNTIYNLYCSHLSTYSSYDRLISTMGFPILVRLHLCIESWLSSSSRVNQHWLSPVGFQRYLN